MVGVFVLLACVGMWALHVDPTKEMGQAFSDSPGSSPDVVVVLIHGTFAPDAGWLAPNSALVQTVQVMLRPRRVLFQPFIWNGLLGTKENNTNNARLAAGEKLGKLLVELRHRWPSSKIILVAHSHGGNVALHAANRYNDVARLSGIVCMGTPFIAVTPRAISDDTPMLMTLKILGELVFFSILLASACLGIGGMGLAFRVGGAGHGITRFATIPIGIVVGVLSFGLMSWSAAVDKDHPYRQEYVSEDGTQPGHYETKTNYVESEAAKELEASIKTLLINADLEWARRKQERLTAEISATTPRAVPVFCLRSAKDEAYRGLHMEDRIAITGTGLLSSRTVSEDVFALAAIIAACVALFVCFKSAFIYLRENKFGFRSVLGALFVGGICGWMAFIICSIVLCIGMLVLAPLAVLARAPAAFPALLAYGSLDLASEYVVDLETLPQPVDWIENHALGSQVKMYDFPGTLGGLEHSKYYLDQDSVKDVAVWILGQVDPKTGEDRPAAPAK